MPARRVPCVGAVVHDDRGRLLLVRRGTEPGRGLWSLPGGRVEPGESAEEAVVREVEEETGLRVEAGRLLGSVERGGPAGVVYAIDDFEARVVGSHDLRAGDDADEARWFAPDEVVVLPCVEGLVGVLRGWGVLEG